MPESYSAAGKFPVTDSASAAGKKGEEQAACALASAGMEIIAKNYRSKFGEVDIIAVDGETIVFVEVKAWAAFDFDNLRYSLNARKQDKIIKTAKYFLFENRKYSNMAIRFDVVFVQNNQVTHLAAAFTESV